MEIAKRRHFSQGSAASLNPTVLINLTSEGQKTTRKQKEKRDRMRWKKITKRGRLGEGSEEKKSIWWRAVEHNMKLP